FSVNNASKYIFSILKIVYFSQKRNYCFRKSVVFYFFFRNPMSLCECTCCLFRYGQLIEVATNQLVCEALLCIVYRTDCFIAKLFFYLLVVKIIFRFYQIKFMK